LEAERQREVELKNTFYNAWRALWLLFALCIVIMPALAENALSAVTISWEAPTTNTDGTPLTDLAGFTIYYGTSTGKYTNTIDAGNVMTYTFNALPDGAYYFVTTAYNVLGIESSYSNEVERTVSSDTTPPVVIAFSVPDTSTSLTVPINTLAATDNVGVTGYLVDESATKPYATAGGWTATAPVSYTFTTAGNRTIYAWAKDAAGNVSASMSVSVAVTLPDTTAPLVPTSVTATVASSSQINLTWTASADPVVTGQVTSGVAGYKVYKDGTLVAATTATTYSATGLSNSTAYSFTVSAYDAAGNSSSQSAAATATTSDLRTASLAASNVAFAVNAGGVQYTDQSGVVYKTDTNYSGGSTASTAATITGAMYGTLYKSVRYGNFSYNIPLANGNYTVTLKFAEIYWNASGRRVFDVSMQGQTVISNMDIFANVGTNATYDISIPVNVTNGMLNIYFTSIVDSACVSAIVVQPVSNQITPPAIQLNPASLSFSATVGTNPSSLTIALSNIGGGTMNWTVVADSTAPAWLSVDQSSGINNGTLTVFVNSASLSAGQYSKNITISGGGQYTDLSTVVYQADTDYSGGATVSTTAPIAGTVDDALYQSVRYGNFSYNIPLANGNYTVTLKFAEIYWNASGRRVFDVSMQGQTVISNMDIFANAGVNAAYDVPVTVNVTNGVLNIHFTSIVDNACVSAIEVSAN
jgi:hypothetical protein